MEFVRGRNLSGPAACYAPFGPDFAAPSAPRASPAQRHVQWHEHPPEGFLRTHDNFGRQEGLAAIPEKRIAHAIEHAGHRRKINRDLVGQPLRPAMREKPHIVGAAPFRIPQDFVGGRHC